MLSPLENHKSTKYSSYEGLNAGKKAYDVRPRGLPSKHLRERRSTLRSDGRRDDKRTSLQSTEEDSTERECFI